MIFLYLIFIIIFIIGIQFTKKEFNDNYLSKETTTIINGFFVITIFFSHFITYINDINKYDQLLINIMSYIGQLMVTSFLFYSGFGIYESIKKKENYIKAFFKKRFIPTFVNFVVAVLLFLIINIIMGNNYPIKTILLSFIGYESIGNSNWYMLAIFSLYIFIMICFNSKIKIKNIYRIITLTFLVVIYIYVISRYKDNYYVDTILCFPVGMFYSYFKDKIDNIFKKKYYLWYIIIFLLFILMYYFSKHFANVGSYNIFAISFIILIVISTMKFKFNNKTMTFLGVHTFWIYILQRIPMIILQNKLDKYIYFICSLLITIVLSYIMNKLMNKLWKRG